MRVHPRILLFTVLVLLFRSAYGADDYTAPGVSLTAGDPAGLTFKPLDRLEVGDSLSVALTGARPRAAVEMLLQDGRGREWSYSLVHSNGRGEVPQTLFWYQSGVIGTTTRRIEHRPDPSFRTFREAETFFAQDVMVLTVRERGGRLLAIRNFRPRPRSTPMVYPSNAQGVLENAINAADENLYVSGRNFPAGATVQLFLVPNRYGYATNDTFDAVDGAVKTIVLGAGQTEFTTELLNAANTVPGSYDIIARLGLSTAEVVLPGDIISFGEDTGVVLYSIIINDNIVMDAAGRLAEAPAYFQFSDAFEKGEDVWAAVDPTDVPAVHPGGNYAAYWTVEHQPESYWDQTLPNLPALEDVSGDGPDIHRVKFSCINVTRRLIWAGATQAEPIKAYDVIVDFGVGAANDAADFVHDNTYNKLTDFIDGYGFGAVGFWVFEPPDAVGPYAVGEVEYLDPNGISGIPFDPSGMTGPNYPITLGWAKIMYPATAAGTGTPVAPGGPYPVALFMHGRHSTCDADGAGPGLVLTSYPCTPDKRIPSHEGYDYIMQKLASQGIFCISINTYEIQFDQGIWNFEARAWLALKFLDKLRDWTTNGTDPFAPGGLFAGQIDMSKVALSGHSRGGEGVVIAQQLNASWPAPHSIVAVNAIAPTDGDNIDWTPTAPYYLLIGARDGDVRSFSGFRTYDRAFKQGMPDRKPKAIGWVYGANHNYFNTIWTPSAELPAPNPWAQSGDDCTFNPMTTPNALGCSFPMSGAAQRQIASSTITAFFRWYLKDVTPYREILTGVVKPAAMDNANVFRTFQDSDRNAIDNFEQQPPFDTATNTVGGAVAAGANFTMFQERLLNNAGTSYNPPPLQDTRFYHDTIGLKLAWVVPDVYTTEIPAGPNRNAEAYTHLTLRVAKKDPGAAVVAGPDVVLFVKLEDGTGNSSQYVTTTNFNRTPHPFLGTWFVNPAQMSGIRIPLRFFTQNNSQVNLGDVAKITISTFGSAEIGIDDIEFGK